MELVYWGRLSRSMYSNSVRLRGERELDGYFYPQFLHRRSL